MLDIQKPKDGYLDLMKKFIYVGCVTLIQTFVLSLPNKKNHTKHSKKMHFHQFTTASIRSMKYMQHPHGGTHFLMHVRLGFYLAP